MGLLLTDIRHTYLQSRPGPLASYDGAALENLFAALRAKALAEAASEGTPPDALRFSRLLELRYVGQGYELPVPCPEAALDVTGRAAISARFHALHENIYGHSAPDSPIEIVNCRLESVAPLPKLRLPPLPAAKGMGAGTAPPHKSSRKVYFAERGGYVETPVYERTTLHAGERIAGPAIVEQTDTTTVVLPDQRLDVDAHGNLILRFA